MIYDPRRAHEGRPVISLSCAACTYGVCLGLAIGGLAAWLICRWRC